jgi:hypothetical protein
MSRYIPTLGKIKNDYNTCRQDGYSKSACITSSVAGASATAFSATAGVAISSLGITTGNVPIFSLGAGIAYMSTDIGTDIKKNILSLFKKEKIDTVPISNPLWTKITKDTKDVKSISKVGLDTLPKDHISYNIYAWSNQYDQVVNQFNTEIIQSSFNLDIGSLITCLASNLLTSMFFSDDKNPNQQIVEIFQTCFVRLGEFINTVRKEMHERFNIVDEKLDIIHKDMIYFQKNIESKLALIETSIERNFTYSNFRLDVINNNILSLESLVGEGFREIQWREIETKVLDYGNYYSRYGEVIPVEYLLDLANVLENTILNPPCVEWLNRNYFNSKPHTKQIDDAYFKDVNPSTYYGWLCEVPVLPCEITNELLKIYQQVRFELTRRNVKYDVDKVILGKLKDKLKSYNKTFTKDDVIKICDEIISSDAKIKEITDLKTKEHFRPYLEKATEIHIQKMNEYLTGFDFCNNVRLYINDNGSDVGDYIHSRLVLERDDFIKYSSNHIVKDLSDYKIMIKYRNCNYWAKHYPIYEEKINSWLKSSIKKEFSEFIKAENLGFGRLNFEWNLELNTPEWNHDIFYRLGHIHEFDNGGGLGPRFDGRVLECIFNVKAKWSDSVSETCLGEYNITNSHNLNYNPDISLMVPHDYDCFIWHYPTSDHTIAIEATKIVGNPIGWTALNKTKDFATKQLLIKQKVDLEMLKINKAIQQDVAEATIIYQSNLIKSKRKLFALTDNEDIYKRGDFVRLLKEFYKNTNIYNYSQIDFKVREKLNYISGKHFKKEIEFDEYFDTIMHEIPEYPAPKPPEEKSISKKDKIKSLFKELTTCLERKEQIEKELEELLEE